MIDPAVARRIRLIGFDVDGVLTDGGLYIGGLQGVKVELKRFDIQDGLGFRLLQLAGIRTALVTGRAGDAARLRAEEVGADEFVIANTSPKLPAFEAVLQRLGVGWDETCYAGDDLIDVPILERVALPVAVANAVPEVKARAKFTTQATGGHGAARELIDALLRAAGVFEQTMERYLAERGDAPRQ